MQKIIEQLQKMLEDIYQYIEQHVDLEQIDQSMLDKTLIEAEQTGDMELQQNILKLKKKLAQHKNDALFWERDVPALTSLLETARERVKSYRRDLLEIGGKNLPSMDIINILDRGILTTTTPVSKIFKGQKYTGHLTEDGYLELTVNGIKKKLSLRRAALFAWKSCPPNQWSFWEAIDSNGEKKPLAYFRKLLADKRKTE
jgi:hypothetical protein